MKMPKIHLNEKQSKTAVVILTLMAIVSSIFKLLYNTYNYLGFLLYATCTAAAVTLFVLFLFKVRRQSQKSHRAFAAAVFLFGLQFVILAGLEADNIIYSYNMYLNRGVNWALYNITYDWINFLCYASVAFLCTMLTIAIYKNKKTIKFKKVNLLVNALLATCIFLNATFENYGYFYNMLHTMVYPCLSFAFYIYYSHNPLVPAKTIDPNAYTPVEALRLLKEQFAAGIIDEEAYARLRSEALKKL